MDLPSVDMSLAVFDDSSDLSDLDMFYNESEQPLHIDEMDIDSEDERLYDSADGSLTIDTCQDERLDLDTDMEHVLRNKRHKSTHMPCQVSVFEKLPTEVLQEIAGYLPADQDVRNLTLSCSTFANVIIPEISLVWKLRFLARYDNPITEGPYDFCIAYQLRRFVLRNFVGFEDGTDRRGQVQLTVLRDMILETYNKAKPQYITPTISRNIICFASPDHSPWMVTFLSAPFYDHGRRVYGRPHALFDALQLTYSHLLLSPASRMAHVVNTSRTNYDLTKVYNWNQEFTTLYTKLPPTHQDSTRRSPKRATRLFPNLRSAIPPETLPIIQYRLDLHSLLHIRNFWHRHLIDDSTGFMANDLGERTYADMARRLSRIGCAPKEWAAPIQDPDSNVQGILNGQWYGHWSCLHPWPKTKDDLVERQTCAEDWDNIDPLCLDFATSTNNRIEGFWPPLFRNIPAFANTMPSPPHPNSEVTYLRGVAPFLNTDGKYRARISRPAGKDKTSTTAWPENNLYLAPRLRGFVHTIADQAEIPGWQRIVMIMYQPTTRHLIQVLEHNAQDYGNPFLTQLHSQQPAQPMQTTQPSSIATQTASVAAFLAVDGGTAAATQPQLPTTTTTTAATPITTPQQPLLSPEEIELRMQAHLAELLRTNPAYFPNRMTRDRIEELEEKFSLSEFLSWDDMDFAYAYEGAIIPGGKIMMGRWWRIGVFGTGDGMEIDADGLGVDVVDDDDDDGNANGNDNEEGEGSESSGNGSQADSSMSGVGPTGTNNNNGNRVRRSRGLERGPFVFWC